MLVLKLQLQLLFEPPLLLAGPASFWLVHVFNFFVIELQLYVQNFCSSFGTT